MNKEQKPLTCVVCGEEVCDFKPTSDEQSTKCYAAKIHADNLLAHLSQQTSEGLEDGISEAICNSCIAEKACTESDASLCDVRDTVKQILSKILPIMDDNSHKAGMQKVIDNISDYHHGWCEHDDMINISIPKELWESLKSEADNG